MFLFLFIIGGCTGKNDGGGQPQNYEKPLGNSTVDKYSENEKARNIVNSILTVPGIKRVIVVVNGKTALIGLDVDNNQSGNINYLKNAAVQKTRSVEPNITNVEVTADKDMYARISKLNEDIINGKPLTGVAEDFISVIRKVNLNK